VTRAAYPTIPPRVDYALTRLGRSLLEPVSELGLWARKNRDAIAEARALRCRADAAIERFCIDPCTKFRSANTA
jgi:DNA-binding HxlR family transcriptional regulator